ncbi:bifunctional nuclease 1-like isoform X2 [Ipomoea triloba]|uniref:bifunctional nuclease 1-like isoform X2 n=1 Tax=Ipomoea triloba TaxID=35885 RepID=UPI00125E0212|nr:bifunctional nuclease 1-like isoform X2 [Ipomoea triloba]
MTSVQGSVVCPVVHAKRTGEYSVPVNSPSVKTTKVLRSGFRGSAVICSRRVQVARLSRSEISTVIKCSFSSSSNGNGNRAENFSENDADYVNSIVLEAVQVQSIRNGFLIKMRDGRHMRCVHNNPQGDHLPEYEPHPAIVLRMEDGTGLLLPIIVLEMPIVTLMAAVRNVQIARPTMYQVFKDMIEKMGYEVKLVRITKRVHEAYFAKLFLSKLGNEGESFTVDLRPSDAINIAVICNVPIQVNKYVAYSDGMRIIESANSLVQGSTSHGSLPTELDRPTGRPCFETEEFTLLRNMLIAAAEGRYIDAAMWRDKLAQHRAKRNWT